MQFEQSGVYGILYRAETWIVQSPTARVRDVLSISHSCWPRHGWRICNCCVHGVYVRRCPPCGLLSTADSLVLVIVLCTLRWVSHYFKPNIVHPILVPSPILRAKFSGQLRDLIHLVVTRLSDINVQSKARKRRAQGARHTSGSRNSVGGALHERNGDDVDPTSREVGSCVFPCRQSRLLYMSP